MKSLLLAVLLAAPGATLAQTQMELTDDACAEYKQVDAALNASYHCAEIGAALVGVAPGVY